MIKPSYCYWSVCDGAYGGLMEQCVRTARQAGVFKEFHVLTDRPVEGCECYDALQCAKAHGLFKLHYLKVGMSRLPFDYFIWVDADTVFTRNPVDALAPLGKSPIHVPLEVDLSAMAEDQEWKGLSCFKLRELYWRRGIGNPVYLSRSAFWIVHREAIDEVYELALQFWNAAKEAGVLLDVSAPLGYAMQLLCADPEAHRVQAHPEIWASDDVGQFAAGTLPNGEPWTWRHPVSAQPITVRPAIVHVPFSKPVQPACGTIPAGASVEPGRDAEVLVQV